MQDITAPDYPAQSDRELVERTAAGDREAFATLYRRHQGAVYRFARLMTGSTPTAEDVVQEVFLILMKDAAKYDAARAALTTYLFGVTRRVTRRRLVRESRLVAVDVARDVERWGVTPDVGEALERTDALQRLRRAILSLPTRYREVVILCDLEGVRYDTAAASIGCAVGTIRSRLHRARQMLATKLRRIEEHHTSGKSSAKSVVMRCAV